MKQRLLTVILAAGCIACGIVGFGINKRQDCQVPEIIIGKNNITYTEGNTYDTLLQDVTAEDNVDGNLTDKIFVDKVIALENDRAMVYYGVVDSGNNVGIAKRKIQYIALKHEENLSENKDAETIEDKDLENVEEKLQPNGVRPAMKLAAKEESIKVGEEFDAMSVIADVVDDIDDKNTLYRHVRMDGKYDVNISNSYDIRYYVQDSDGNLSDPILFTLKVE